MIRAVRTGELATLGRTEPVREEVA
jgi:hypothetical protein